MSKLEEVIRRVSADLAGRKQITTPDLKMTIRRYTASDYWAEQYIKTLEARGIISRQGSMWRIEKHGS